MDNNIHINPESIGKFKAISDVPVPEGYESPITGYISRISQQIIEQRDNAIVEQINEQIAVDFNKEELIKALNYDRNQFNEGYRKGYRDAREKYEEANRWTKITYRPMTKEEEIEYKREFGIDYGDTLTEYENRVFTCELPQDKQDILIQTKWGVKQDICEWEDGCCGLEENGDWDGVIAWRPTPEYKESEEEE